MDMTVEVPELPELTFDEASHIYRLNGDIIPSVSKLMEPLKDQCYGGISKRTLENAAIKGSAVHNSIENWIKFGIDDIPSEHRGYQFFPTPRAVAERMCEMAEIDSASEVLEPSCGNGQLADVIWEHLPAGMCCIELNTDMKRYLSEKPYGVSYRDFLDVTKKEIGAINRVVMNPPFTRHQDIDHVRHAYDLLDAGGILVAIMCESTFFRTDKKSVEFRDFLDSVYAQAIKLEPGAFRESGTDVVTRIVKIRKPM